MSASSISIVPPGPGGVRDYAGLLGQALDAPLVELGPQMPVDGYGGRLLCLHFSGYGYQSRGVPLWLVRAMRDMRPRFDSIGIVFHELFAVGPPWGSAFWLTGMQKRIAKDLLAMADFWITSREESARWLLAASARPVPHKVLPIFSNVGEPAAIDGPRKPRIVVFGSAGVRANVYQWRDGEIFRSAQRNRLEIHDIGPSFASPSDIALRLAAHGAVVHGKLPAEAVSAVLSESRYGALAYPASDVAKSSVFPAYCAHGLCPVLLCPSYDTKDGLIADRHYLRGFQAVDEARIDPEAVGQAAWGWYEPHRVSVHQESFRELELQSRRTRAAAAVAGSPLRGIASRP